MSMSVKDVLQQTDWVLLREQKALLPDGGLLNFIDALQDAVVAEGIATEQQVFGELNDDDN